MNEIPLMDPVSELVTSRRGSGPAGSTHSMVIWDTRSKVVKSAPAKLSLYWPILMASSHSSTELKLEKSGTLRSRRGRWTLEESRDPAVSSSSNHRARTRTADPAAPPKTPLNWGNMNVTRLLSARGKAGLSWSRLAALAKTATFFWKLRSSFNPGFRV